MAIVLSFPTDKIFRPIKDRNPKREVFPGDETIPDEKVPEGMCVLMRHKKTGVVHHENRLNDDYLYCGHFLWPDYYKNFEKFFGDEDEVTCEKCMFNGPAFPAWWRAL